MAESLGVAAALVRLSYLVQSVYAECTERYGVTPAHAQLMCVLRGGPCSMRDLGALLRLGKSTMTGLVDRAEQHGLVRRTTVAGDRRVVAIELTDHGHTITEGFYADVTDRMHELVDILGDTNRALFAQLCSEVVQDAAAPAVFLDITAAP